MNNILTLKHYASTNNPKELPHVKGDTSIKAAGVKEPIMQWEYDEIVKCKADIKHFIENWCLIDTGKGKKKFILYPYQIDALRAIQNNRFCIGLAPRQMGKSQLMAAYILWFILFNSNKSVYITSKDVGGAKDIISRIVSMMRELPFFLQQGARKFSVTYCQLDNNSSVRIGSSKASSGRGITGDLIFADEFAFLPQSDIFYEALYPIISGKEDAKTQLVIMSTPFGVGNKFHELWKNAVDRRNTFFPIRWKWNDRPGRDEKFKNETIANIGVKSWRSEYECEFIGSSNTLIDGSALEKLIPIQPIKTSANGTMRLFEEPIAGHNYAMGVDVSQGLGQDASAFHVIDVTAKPYKQVMTFQDANISPYVYHTAIITWARYFNNAYIIIENNNHGAVVCQNLLEGDDDEKNPLNIYYSPPKNGKSQMGMTTTIKTKSEGTQQLKEMVENGLIVINDVKTIEEMMYFERLKSSWGASVGKHDDLVMALVIFAYLTYADPIFKEIEKTDVSLSRAIQLARMKQVEEKYFPMPFMFSDEDDEYYGGWSVY